MLRGVGRTWRAGLAGSPGTWSRGSERVSGSRALRWPQGPHMAALPPPTESPQGLVRPPARDTALPCASLCESRAGQPWAAFLEVCPRGQGLRNRLTVVTEKCVFLMPTACMVHTYINVDVTLRSLTQQLTPTAVTHRDPVYLLHGLWVKLPVTVPWTKFIRDTQGAPTCLWKSPLASEDVGDSPRRTQESVP